FFSFAHPVFTPNVIFLSALLGAYHNGPKLWGACQRWNTPQEWGRKPFGGERQKRKNGGTT
ncbi:hypothetical protein, partial [uncultured Flavonifractor sp.]